jgi:nitrogen regulatory protein PII
LEDVHEILRDVNAGGMSYYRIERAGKIKAERVTVGKLGSELGRKIFVVDVPIVVDLTTNEIGDAAI